MLAEPTAHRTAARVRENPRVLALQIVFWLCAALIVWTQLGYALALAALARVVAPPLPRHANARRGAPTGAEPIKILTPGKRCRPCR